MHVAKGFVVGLLAGCVVALTVLHLSGDTVPWYTPVVLAVITMTLISAWRPTT